MIRRIHALACAPMLVLALVAPAAAIAAAGPGGAGIPERPQITAVTCSTGELWACRPGGQLLATGSGLDSVRAVVLLGGPGSADDQRIAATPADPTQLSVALPAQLRAGRIEFVSPAGNTTPDRRLAVLATPAPSSPGAAPDPGSTALAPGESLYAGSLKQAVFTVNLPVPASVEAYAVGSGAAVRSWSLPAGPGEVRWDGTVSGVPVADGRYAFRVAGDVTARAARAPSDPIVIHDAVFPIRGEHDLGQTPTNGFGGPRRHGGQDMFAKCGTPLVAVRPGKILLERFQARAGNYVVVQDGTGRSYVYMHMRDKSLVPKDGVVKAGQLIGYVGQTGQATGCHLHFELWTAPGFYLGGKAIDPLPELKRWNAFR